MFIRNGFILLALSLILVFVPPPVLAQSCPRGPVAGSAPAIRFGAALSFSGKYALEGAEIFSGYQLWSDWVNTEHGGIDVNGVCHRAELVTYDDRSDPDTVAAAVEALIVNRQSNFILGPFSSTLIQVASVTAERENVLMMHSGGADESLFGRGLQNLFGLVSEASAYFEGPIEQVFRLGARTAVVAYEETAFPLL